MNFTELTAQVRGLLGKSTDDTLITATRVGLWLNEAQRKLAGLYPGLRDLMVLDKANFRATDGAYELALSGAASTVGTIFCLWYVQKSNKTYRKILPYPGGKQAWDTQVIPEIMANVTGGYPTYYFRRGSSIEVDWPAGATQNPLTVTGATATDASPSVVTSVGAFAGETLTGTDVYLTGTNIVTGWYKVASHTDDALTMESNCCSGGAGSAVVCQFGGIYWLEYSQIPPTMSGTDNPVITLCDLALVHQAEALALISPVMNKMKEGLIVEQYAHSLMHERQDRERARDRSHTIPYQGP